MAFGGSQLRVNTGAAGNPGVGMKYPGAGVLYPGRVTTLVAVIVRAPSAVSFSRYSQNVDHHCRSLVVATRNSRLIELEKYQRPGNRNTVL